MTVDMRKFRKETKEPALKSKFGGNQIDRHHQVRALLIDLAPRIEDMARSGMSQVRILNKLIEAGGPSINIKTFRSHLRAILPDVYRQFYARGVGKIAPTTFHCPLASGASIPEHLIQPTVEAVPIKMPAQVPTPAPTQAPPPTPAPVQKPAQPTPPPAPLKEVSEGDKIERWGEKFIGTYDRMTFDPDGFNPNSHRAKAQRVKMETALCNIFGGGTLNNMRAFTRDISLTQTAADIINLNSGDDYNQLINKLVDAGISAPDELFSIRKKLPLIESVYKLNNSIIKAKSQGMPLGYIAQIKDTLNKINFDYLAEKPEHVPFMQAFGILLKKAVDNQLTSL